MAGNSTVAAMTAASALTGADLFYVVQGGADRKATATQVGAFASGGITVGTTTIASGTTTRILYDNGGVLGEYTITGSGTVVAMSTSPVLVTPTLGVASATSLAASAQVWSGSVSSALSSLTGAVDGFRSSAANVTALASENTTASSATQGGFVGMYSNDGAALGSGDRLGGIRMGGSSSASAIRNSTVIAGFADQAWVDASAYGSRIELQNTTNGATTPSTKAILSNAGLFALGATLANTVPALKPSSTTLQARLGDDSAFASVQGKITTEANATTGLVAGALAALTTATIVIYDATGTAYRVPCVTP